MKMVLLVGALLFLVQIVAGLRAEVNPRASKIQRRVLSKGELAKRRYAAPSRTFDVKFGITLGETPAVVSSFSVIANDSDGSSMYYYVASHGGKVVAVNLTTHRVVWTTSTLPHWQNGTNWVVANDGSDTVMVSSNGPRSTQGYTSRGEAKFAIDGLVFDPPPDYQYHAATNQLFAEGYDNDAHPGPFNQFFVVNETTGAVSNSTKCPEVRFNSKHVYLHTPLEAVGNATITAYKIPNLEPIWNFTSVNATGLFQQILAGVGEKYVLVRSKRETNGFRNDVDVLDADTGDLVSHLIGVPKMWDYPTVLSPTKGPQFYDHGKTLLCARVFHLSPSPS